MLNILIRYFAIPSKEQIIQLDLTGETTAQNLATGYDIQKECTESDRELIEFSIVDDLDLFLNRDSLNEVLTISNVFSADNFFENGKRKEVTKQFVRAFWKSTGGSISGLDRSELENRILESITALKDTPYIQKIYVVGNPRDEFVSNIEHYIKDPSWVSNVSNLVIESLELFKGSKAKNAANIIDLAFNNTKNKKYIVLNDKNPEEVSPEIKKIKVDLFLKDFFWIAHQRLSDQFTKNVRTILVIDEAKLVFPAKPRNEFQKQTINNCRDLLDHYARKKSFGFLVATQKFDQIDSQILSRLESHDLFAGFGINRSYDSTIKERCSDDSFKEYKELNQVFAPGGQLKEFQFFGLGSFSPLNFNGKGVLLNFKVEDYV